MEHADEDVEEEVKTMSMNKMIMKRNFLNHRKEVEEEDDNILKYYYSCLKTNY